MIRGTIAYRKYVRKIAEKAYNLGYRMRDSEFVAMFWRVPISDLEHELLKLERRNTDETDK